MHLYATESGYSRKRMPVEVLLFIFDHGVIVYLFSWFSDRGNTLFLHINLHGGFLGIYAVLGWVDETGVLRRLMRIPLLCLVGGASGVLGTLRLTYRQDTSLVNLHKRALSLQKR